MKYTDALGKPLKKEDVQLAVQVIAMHSTISAMQLNRAARLGIAKSANILKLLQHANVVGPSENGTRNVIMRGYNSHSMALNAALRQLKKGKR